MSTPVYQTSTTVGVPSNSIISTIFGDSVDMTFAVLSGFLTSLLLFWVLGVSMRDSMQCGVLAIGGIYIAKSMFDSFFVDSRIAVRQEQLRTGYDQNE